MREFKFRAWDGNKMIHPTLVKNGVWHKDKDLILMQYTGLKDCEGNEIYEGDEIVLNGRKHIVEYGKYGEWRIGMFLLSSFFRECTVTGNKFGEVGE